MSGEERLIPVDCELEFEQYYSSLKALADEGLKAKGVGTVDNNLQISAYLHAADKVFGYAQESLKTDSYDFAWYHFYKYSVLAIEVIPKHRAFSSLPPQEAQSIRKRAGESIGLCEKLKAEGLRVLHESEMDRVRKERKRQEQMRCQELELYLRQTEGAETSGRERLLYDARDAWRRLRDAEDHERAAACAAAAAAAAAAEAAGRASPAGDGWQPAVGGGGIDGGLSRLFAPPGAEPVAPPAPPLGGAAAAYPPAPQPPAPAAPAAQQPPAPGPPQQSAAEAAQEAAAKRVQEQQNLAELLSRADEATQRIREEQAAAERERAAARERLLQPPSLPEGMGQLPPPPPGSPPPGMQPPQPPPPPPPPDPAIAAVAAFQRDAEPLVKRAAQLLEFCQGVAQRSSEPLPAGLQRVRDEAASTLVAAERAAAALAAAVPGHCSAEAEAHRSALSRQLAAAMQAAGSARDIAAILLTKAEEEAKLQRQRARAAAAAASAAAAAEAEEKRRIAERNEAERQRLEQELQKHHAELQKQKQEEQLRQQHQQQQMQQQQMQQQMLRQRPVAPAQRILTPAEQELARLQSELAALQKRPAASPPRRRPPTVPWVFDDRRFALSSTRQPRRGIVNLGNTCYMNSVLQALGGTRLAEDFASDRPLKDRNLRNPLGFQGRIADAYHYIAREMCQNCTWSISPSGFKRTIGQRNPQFEGISQQDANEFLRTLLGGLHDDLNRARLEKAKKVPELSDTGKDESLFADECKKAYQLNNNSVIDEWFGFMERSTLTCPRCRHVSRNFTVQQSLEIPIDTSRDDCSLYDCMAKYTARERLDEDSKWSCSSCRQRVRAEKRLSLWTGPHVLVVTLKRFCTYGNLADKIRQPVAIPFEFDVSPFVNDGSGPPQLYELAAVVNHDGGMGGGHYTCDVRGREDGLWHFFSDERWHPSRGPPNARQAYILMFRRKQ